MALYGNCVIYCDGILLSHETTIDYNKKSNDQDCETVVLGWDGISPSPDMTVISCEQLMPVAGADFDLSKAKTNRTEIEVRLQQIGSGKTLTSKGYVMDLKNQFGVGKQSTESFEFHGKPADWEG